MALYVRERHEPLTDQDWDEGRARTALARIVSDTNAAFTPDGLWRIHPFDVSSERPPDALKSLYNGAAGVIAALHHLAAKGFAPLAHDFVPVACDLQRRWHADLAKLPEVRAYNEPDNLMTDLGFHLLEWKLAPSSQVEDKLAATIATRIGDNRGFVWGAAGAMRAALFLHAATGDARWRDLFVRHADALWQSWQFDVAAQCHLWTVDLYSVADKRLTPLHGFFANAGALFAGRHLLAPDRAVELLDRIVQTTRATARIEGEHANWPVSWERSAPTNYFLQFCNGAPGVISNLATFPDTRLDDLFLKGAELTWSAGPVIKMPSLCHGAPSAGFAFLKLHARTRDPRWLDRARRFAMHAFAQAEAAKAQYGQRKFSLWTGDIGLAVFLAACVSGDCAIPTFDAF